MAQLSSWYEPGIALSSGLNFSGNSADESAIWVKNCIRFTKGESSPGYFCVNLGYARRSYYLDYYSPLLESSSSGIISRNELVLQFGPEIRLKNIRKLRKVLHPYAGVFFQRQFYKISDDIKAAQAHFSIDGYGIALRNVVLEVGSEFVSAKWPRFHFAFQIEPPLFTTQVRSEKHVTISESDMSETQKVDTYYHHMELPCVRLLLGLNF